MERYNGKVIILNGGSQHDRNEGIQKELLEIADDWFEKSKLVGDIGCCVLGARLEFKLDNEEYKMYPQSPWQGEGSWTGNVNHVSEALKKLGAKEIEWFYGMMD